MDMPDTGSRRYHFPGFGVALALFSQTANINRVGGHLDRTIRPMPGISGTVLIEFETIAIGVRDVKRFTYQVIALTNLPTNSGEAQKCATEVRSRWEEDSDMVETSCSAWLGRGARNFDQFQKWLFILAAEDNFSSCLLDSLETEQSFIKST